MVSVSCSIILLRSWFEQTVGCPAHFRTCFNSIDIVLHEQFAKNVLDYDKDDMDTSTYENFNTWIHALLLDPSEYTTV